MGEVKKSLKIPKGAVRTSKLKNDRQCPKEKGQPMFFFFFILIIVQHSINITDDNVAGTDVTMQGVRGI